ncbi:Endoribonuclease VapD [Beijerinckiaceae bacterium RH AL1]|nr:virulence factor [Beijerinckiaceae bacterium]VVB45376.1 Endoribonuclease VapD [Beijerinckiaceae bacterium RH CH11]VVB45454.1 Endoribonuclease VapD [Beijerinckiaceae bacterium RH AL8]VVC54835.1 Endoribonuclease VapD [Beijerinckiaceae bacterium RH AL1]
MFAIAFDLVVAETARQHPKSVSQAYADIGARLAEFGFDRVQGSLYIGESEDLANLFAAIMALKALPWLPPSVRDIRAFRVEQWSDFTKLVKS